MDQKGNLSFAFLFLILAIITTMIFVVFVPMMQVVNSELFEISDDLIVDANSTVNDINNTQLRSQIQDNFQSQRDSYTFQLDLLGGLNKYAAIIIIILILIVFILLTRSLVARSQGAAF